MRHVAIYEKNVRNDDKTTRPAIVVADHESSEERHVTDAK